MDTQRALENLSRDLAAARAAALLAGRVVEVTGLADNPGVGDQVTLTSWAASDPDDSQVEITWELTGTGHGLRTRARATAPARRSRSERPRALRALRALSVAAAHQLLAAPVAGRQPPGPCACCGRTAPEPARLDRSPIGLCHGCEAWHAEAAADTVPSAGCRHASRFAAHDPSGPRWWRNNPRTDPVGDDDAWVVSAFASAGLDVCVGGTGAFDAWSVEAGEAWVEVTHFQAGGWEASRSPHPGSGWPARERVRPVRWQLRDDVALHEIVAVMAALVQGALVCPDEAALPD